MKKLRGIYMSIAIVTGSAGLIGSESVRFFSAKGMSIVGIDNDMRAYFFGPDASTQPNLNRLRASIKDFRQESIDIRDEKAVNALFKDLGKNISAIIHTAAQPSHDWAAREPMTDFSINATGTLILLEATRKWCPEAAFIFTSTNKVYGDTPNRLPLVETETRWEVDSRHQYFTHGVDTSMSIDQSKHSLFGASKVAADLLVQEYGRYFGMKTGVFRGGCLTGPAHSGAELHGFLAYLVKCALQGRPYTIFGYKGKQVRDNIHSYDLVNAFWHYFQKPKPAAVYNMGGARLNSCSVLEAIDLIEQISKKKISFSISNEARSGDHIWWISDVREFKADYAKWDFKYDLRTTVSEMIDVFKQTNN